MKTKFFLIPCLIIILLLSACSTTQKLDQDNNGETITLAVGEEIQIKLNGNVTTGYEWSILSVDETILAANGEADYKTDSNSANRVGAGGEFTFTFTAQNAGETQLELGYQRPWENEPPIETYTLTVVVQ